MCKKRLVTVIAVAALLGLPCVAFATCNAAVAATAPDARFTDNGNGTVSDSRTGLMWKQCSEGQTSATTPCTGGAALTFTWQQALQRADTVNGSGGFAGHSDWRLPNSNELASLVERQCTNPAINATRFPNTVASYYWSSSPDAYSSASAWYVYFYNGYVNDNYKTSSYYVRLVRGQ